MSELWTPNANYTIDVNNVYDMMMVFQDRIDAEMTPEAKFQVARFAVVSMGRMVRELDDDKRLISLTADMVLLDGTDDVDREIVEGLGVTGILDDVHGVSVGNRLPLAMSLQIDVLNVFPMGEPMNNDLAPGSAIAPINKVHYIETHAA